MEDVQIEKTSGLIFVVRYGNLRYYLGKRAIALYEVDMLTGASKNYKSVEELPEVVLREYLIWKMTK